MRANLRTLFHDHDRETRVELHEPAPGGKTRRPTANDHHIEFHGFAFDSFCHID